MLIETCSAAELIAAIREKRVYHSDDHSAIFVRLPEQTVLAPQGMAVSGAMNMAKATDASPIGPAKPLQKDKHTTGTYFHGLAPAHCPFCRTDLPHMADEYPIAGRMGKESASEETCPNSACGVKIIFTRSSKGVEAKAIV